MGDPAKHGDNPLVKLHYLLAVDAAERWWARQIRSALSYPLADEQHESALETIFAVWWESIRLANLDTPRGSLVLTAQECFGRYHVDFEVRSSNPQITFPRIGIEVDGHAWHERTHEQASARSRRDRVFQAAGWRLFHFTETEVLDHPSACVEEVMAVAIGTNKA